MPARSDAAEWKMDIGQLHQRVVVSKSARDAPLHTFYIGCAVAEEVSGERRGVFFDDGECFFDGIVAGQGNDGQDWAKDFFLHAGMKEICFDESGRKSQRLFVSCPTKYNDFAVIKHTVETPEVPFMNDMGQVLGGIFRSELLYEGFFEFIFEIFPQIILNQNIVRCDAGLSGIDEFGKDDAFCSRLNVFAVRDDAGRFSAEFKNCRREVFCGCACNIFGCFGTAGKEDEIELFFQQFGSFFRAGLNDCESVRVEVFGDEFLAPRGCCRSELGGFEYSDIAGTDRSDQWGEHELNRVVPWADDERQAARLRLNGGFCRSQKDRRTDSVWFYPSGYIFECVSGFVLYDSNFCNPCLAGWFGEVLLKRFREVFGLFFEHLQNGFELSFSPFEIKSDSGMEVISQVLNGLFHGIYCTKKMFAGRMTIARQIARIRGAKSAIVNAYS